VEFTPDREHITANTEVIGVLIGSLAIVGCAVDDSLTARRCKLSNVGVWVGYAERGDGICRRGTLWGKVRMMWAWWRFRDRG
jgi:hypothetical protein